MIPNSPTVDRLLKKISKKNTKGETPLHTAAIRGSSRLVRQLLQMGADPNAQDNAEWAALHEACNRGNIGVVRVLHKFGADINLKGFGKDSPLHDAARNGHLKVVKYLTRAGACLNAKNAAGRTPREEAELTRLKITENEELEKTITYLIDHEDGGSVQVPSEPNSVETSSAEEEEDDDDEEAENNDLTKFLGLTKSPVVQQALQTLGVSTPSSSSGGGSSAKKAKISSASPTSSSTTTPTSARTSGERIRGGLKPDLATKVRLTYGSESPTAAASAPSSKNGKNNVPDSTITKPVNYASSTTTSLSPSPATDNNNPQNNENDSVDDKTADDRGDKMINATEAVQEESKAQVAEEAKPDSASEEPMEVDKEEEQEEFKEEVKDDADEKMLLQEKEVETKDKPSDVVMSEILEPDQKVPPLKIVIPILKKSLSAEETCESSKKIVQDEQQNTNKEEADNLSSGTEVRLTRSRALNPSRSATSSPLPAAVSIVPPVATTSTATVTTASNVPEIVNRADYDIKKRKLARSYQSSSSAAEASDNDTNKLKDNKDSKEKKMPLTDIEKYINIRKQVEQRRKNIFPVQPKPPHGFKDYLMNRKTYLLQGNAHERLQSMPMLKPPPSLDGPMKDLFVEQEKERYKLRTKHMVEKEKLILSVEQVSDYYSIVLSYS